MLGDMVMLRPDVEFRVEEDMGSKVTRFLAHRKVVEALLGPVDQEVVIVKDVAGEAFGALLAFLYQPANFDVSSVCILSLLQLFSLSHRFLPNTCYSYYFSFLKVVLEFPFL